MSARRKDASKAAGRPSKTIPADEAPTTLSAIFEGLIEAHALVYVACRFMEESDDDDYGHGVFVLHQGVATLEKLLKQAERAALQAKRAQKQGGAS